jgi:OPT family oligopeptide transporter
MSPKAPHVHEGSARGRRNRDIGGRGIPLSQIPPKSLEHDSPSYSDEDLDPESDAALLRRHREEEEDDDDEVELHNFHDHAVSTPDIINPIRRFFGFMSKAPLLLRSAPGFGTGSYGAAPVGTSTDNSDEDENGDLRWGDRRKRGSPLKNAHSSNTLRASDSEGTTRRRSSNARRRNGSASMGTDVALDGGLTKGATPIPIPNTGHVGEDNDTESDESLADEVVIIDDEDPPDNSPYAQVRASVSATDNTSLSINTPRMWVLSMLFAILGSSTNLFFSLRYPSVSITPVIALLLVHPLGLLWDQCLKRPDDPEDEYVDGIRSGAPSINTDTNYEPSRKEPDSKLRSLRLWLSQGRWNEKEHSCVYISSNVSFGFAFATDVIVEQTHFYNQKVSITYQLLLTLSTQILGYTFAGLTRRFLVRPGGMIWPGTLMSAAMFTTLHKEENTIANGWKITRWKFFFVVWFCAFVFYFLPGLLFPALSYFSVITWFAPKNVVIANLFGVSSGLGLFPVTFDWAQIAYIGSPLITPFWAAMNVVGGLVIVMWIIAPIAYYKNVFFSSYMPILSSAVFDNTGKIYDVSKILTKDFLFDREAYEKYSRVYLPITYVLSYGLQFAALASLLSHTACWHGKDIWKQWTRSLKEVEAESKTTYQPVATSSNGTRDRRRLSRSESHLENIISQEDVHNRLMRKYKDAPLSWYLITFVSMTAVGMFVVE